MTRQEARRRIVFALDVPDAESARGWVERLGDRVGMYKVGKQLFTAMGPSVVSTVRERGGELFLDLKYHDIPNTVAMAVVEAARLGVTLVNLHALGGYEMMARAAEALRKADPAERTRLIAVTILTSSTEETLREVGIDRPVEEMVVRLATLARRAGIDGVVASPRETPLIREACGDGFLIVTPGVRPLFAAADDQKRVMTPREAIAAGSDYLVIGRPIAAHPDPVAAVEMIVDEMTRP